MKLDHIVVLVSRLEISLPFYHTLLCLIGFEKSRDHVYGNADGVHLDLKQASMPEHHYQRYAPGLNHMGFTASSREEVVRIGKSMQEAGFEVPEIQDFGEESALFFKDPDGMRIEVASY